MNNKEFEQRRRQLMRKMQGNSIAILPTASVRHRNGDVEFPFRADSDFYYLTGFPEPEAVAVFVPGREQGEYILFCRERDPEKETWHGRRAGLEGACKQYGADDAFPITDINDILPGLMENRERVFYTLGQDADFDLQVLGWLNMVRRKVRTGVDAPDEFTVLSVLLHEMRLHKTKAELETMRKAANISVAAHQRVMQICKPGIYEYQLEAELLHTFTAHGSRAPAYPPIIGGGENGCILHYTENKDVLKDGDLVLIDAGAEYDGYAADITRTFPVNGRFTEAQREAYELVLEAQYAAIQKAIPGNRWNDPHDEAVRVLTKGLVHLGILKGKINKLIEKQAYKTFYMHRTGHWLGMDVHDVGKYKLHEHWRLLEPGMVMTVEPGLYFKAHTKHLDKRWWDIGIRIEDDVVITNHGNEVLTEGAPKTVEQIENCMNGG